LAAALGEVQGCTTSSRRDVRAMAKPVVMTENDVEVGERIRMWLMASPKAGKTTSVLTTCPGPTFVMNCDPLGSSALAGARRYGAKFDWMPCLTASQFSKCMRVIRDGDYATVVADSFNLLIKTIETEFLEDCKGDGRRAYPALQRECAWMIHQLFEIPGHLIVTTHWIENGTEGEGIAPMLPGKLKGELPADFSDVVFLKAEKKNGVRRRILVCAPEGAWGPGTRSIDEEVIDADIGLFIDLAKESLRPKRSKSRRRDDDDDDRRSRDYDEDDEDDDRRGRR
jgi:hypothetical protein